MLSFLFRLTKNLHTPNTVTFSMAGSLPSLPIAPRQQEVVASVAREKATCHSRLRTASAFEQVASRLRGVRLLFAGRADYPLAAVQECEKKCV